MVYHIKKGTQFRGARDAVWKVTSKHEDDYTAKLISGTGRVLGQTESGFDRSFIRKNRLTKNKVMR